MDNHSLSKVQKEFSHLKNPYLFTPHFKPTYINELYHHHIVKTSPQTTSLINTIEKQLVISYSESVYHSLKFLCFAHQMLRDSHSKVIERITGLLSKLTNPAFKNSYEEYTYGNLVLPYRQYLLKLGATYFDTNTQDYEHLYCLYNLIIYALRQFYSPIREFSRFFAQYYPALNDYAPLIGRDLTKAVHTIRLSYDANSIPNLTFIEVEQLQQQLENFHANGSRYTNTWILPQTNAHSYEVLEDTERTEEGLERRVLGEIFLNRQ